MNENGHLKVMGDTLSLKWCSAPYDFGLEKPELTPMPAGSLVVPAELDTTSILSAEKAVRASAHASYAHKSMIHSDGR